MDSLEHTALAPHPPGWAEHRGRYAGDRAVPLSGEQLLDAIRSRAFHLYLQRRHQGLRLDPVADWLQAECELIARHGPGT